MAVSSVLQFLKGVVCILEYDQSFVYTCVDFEIAQIVIMTLLVLLNVI